MRFLFILIAVAFLSACGSEESSNAGGSSSAGMPGAPNMDAGQPPAGPTGGDLGGHHYRFLGQSMSAGTTAGEPSITGGDLAGQTSMGGQAERAGNPMAGLRRRLRWRSRTGHRCCLQISRQRLTEYPPAGLMVSFRLLGCDGTPIPRLTIMMYASSMMIPVAPWRQCSRRTSLISYDTACAQFIHRFGSQSVQLCIR